MGTKVSEVSDPAPRPTSRNRTRNWRARRRRGAVRVAFELSPLRLAYLATDGYLDGAAKVTPKAATLAIEAFLADHLPT